MTRQLSSSSAGVVVGRGLATGQRPGGAAPSVAWVNIAGTSSAGPVVTNTGGSGGAWDAAAKTAKKLTAGDGWVTFEITSTSPMLFVGVATNPGLGGGGNTAYTTLDWAVFLDVSGGQATYTVWSLGSPNSVSGTAPAVGDRIRVGVLAGSLVAQVSQDGGASWTTLDTDGMPTYPLYGAAAFNTLGGSVTGISLSGAWS